MSEVKRTKKLDKDVFMATFWRTALLQGCFNYERQQGIGFGYSMIPALEKIYADDEEGYNEALKRHLQLFNITPQMSSFVNGMVIAMEEEAALNENFDTSAINSIKTAFMGPLSGIGDSIFWGTLRTVGLGIGLSFSIEGNILGPIIFLLIHNIPGWYVRYKGLEIGYASGTEFLETAEETGNIEKFGASAKILGSVVVGAMIATMIKFSTTLTITMANEQVFVFQDALDQIMPNLLPLALAFGTFAAVRKGKKTTTIMFMLFLLAFVIAFLESLAFFAPVAG